MTETTATYDGTMERTADGGGVIRFERRLAHPIDQVWDAITTPERLADWWLPFDADISVDLRVGGELVFTAAGDEPVQLTCTILELDAPTLLVHTHPAAGSVLRWELAPVDDGCVLRLSHTVTDAEDAVGSGFVVGLHTSLSRLEPCLSGTPVPWDWAEHDVTQAAYAERGLATAPQP
jgi:uncharacterized protein YndB with AHSA1/START domain